MDYNTFWFYQLFAFFFFIYERKNLSSSNLCCMFSKENQFLSFFYEQQLKIILELCISEKILVSYTMHSNFMAFFSLNQIVIILFLGSVHIYIVTSYKQKLQLSTGSVTQRTPSVLNRPY